MNMETTTDYREYHKRQHRLWGQWLLLTINAHSWDYAYLGKDEFMRFLDLERMREERKDWIVEDLGEIFPTIIFSEDDHGTVNGIFVALKRTDEGKRSEVVKMAPPKAPFNSFYGISLFLEANGLSGGRLYLPEEPAILTSLALFQAGIKPLKDFRQKDNQQIPEQGISLLIQHRNIESTVKEKVKPVLDRTVSGWITYIFDEFGDMANCSVPNDVVTRINKGDYIDARKFSFNERQYISLTPSSIPVKEKTWTSVGDKEKAVALYNSAVDKIRSIRELIEEIEFELDIKEVKTQ